jgi:erythronate-4-phosphate dehydrogenase
LINIIADKDIPNLDNHLNELLDSNFFRIKYLHYLDININTIKDCEVLLVRSTIQVNESLLKETNIKFVGSATAGINHLDMNYLNKNNIQWDYAPGCNSSSVTHYILAVFAELIDQSKLNYNSKIGIVGYGNIGKKIANYLYSLGFTVLINDPFLKDPSLVDLKEILDCDLISLHVPYIEDGDHPTQNLIDEKELLELKNKILINSSRGGIVNEKALLKQKSITYISDVWNNEPLPSKALVKQSLISTPHIAGYSKQGKLNSSKLVAYSVARYIEASKNMNPFNFKDPSDKKVPHYEPTDLESQPYPLHVFKDSFNIKSISTEMKKLFNQDIKNEFLSKAFNQMRSSHPKRDDYDSKEFIEKYT